MPSERLIFTNHARLRIEQIGLAWTHIQALFDEGKFVLVRSDDSERHFVCFLPDHKEHYLMVVGAGSQVVTFMPLIWRNREVSDVQKAEAYDRAMGLWKERSKPVVVVKKTGKFKVHLRSKGTSFNLGQWPGETAIEDLIPQIIEAFDRIGDPEATCVVAHGRDRLVFDRTKETITAP